jgi:hypothetical protein
VPIRRCAGVRVRSLGHSGSPSRSPSSAARCVEPTMCVNRTVTRTEHGWGRHVPVGVPTRAGTGGPHVCVQPMSRRHYVPARRGTRPRDYATSRRDIG